MNPYTFRPYTKEDVNFIQSSWGHSYYKGSDFSDYMSPTTFHYHHRPIRERILSKDNVAIIVCVANTNENQIIGWICVETLHDTKQLIVHYVYVKELYKGEGIANDLFNRAVTSRPVFVSHLTDKALRILSKKSRDDFYYAPHLI